MKCQDFTRRRRVWYPITWIYRSSLLLLRSSRLPKLDCLCKLCVSVTFPHCIYMVFPQMLEKGDHRLLLLVVEKGKASFMFGVGQMKKKLADIAIL